MPEPDIYSAVLEERVASDPMRFLNRARDLVLKFYNSNEELGQIAERNVRVTWSNYTLGNAKALLTTDNPDDLYFEVTYNHSRDEVYLDVYGKLSHTIHEL